ncbi:MAG: DUF4907 domain-containing protein [Bacteroidia bacterium]|nr:DUF4907 domain-containing protein [Bacteroidia bacterium]
MSCFAIACNSSNKSEQSDVNDSTQQVVTNQNSYSCSVFRNVDSSFGYSILSNGKSIIKQDYMPAYSGNRGFKDSISAQIIANFVISKLNLQQFPPSVSKNELDSLLKLNIN